MDEQPLAVLFLDTWSAVPVFHRVEYLGLQGPVRKDGWQIVRRTLCGQVLARRRQPPGEVVAFYDRGGTTLRTQHAEKFGRPCKVCFHD